MESLTKNQTAMGVIIGLAIAAVAALVFMVISNRPPEVPKGANMVIGPNNQPMQLPAAAKAEMERQRAAAFRGNIR